tara:strand:- start:2300 stop:3181 length:882 start_codon:yes stop_codon:yes gene_type:complete
MSDGTLMGGVKSISTKIGKALEGGDWLGGAVQLGGMLLNNYTRPDSPRIEDYVPEEIPDRDISDFDPSIPLLQMGQADVALKMLGGELPSSVVDQIRATAGERAVQAGYSSSEQRVRNVTARDLGLKQMDMISQGFSYANQLYNRAQAALDQAYSIDSARANQAYDAWAAKYKRIMDQHNNAVEQHNDFWSELTNVGSRYVQSARIAQERKSAKEDTKTAAAKSDQIISDTDKAAAGRMLAESAPDTATNFYYILATMPETLKYDYDMLSLKDFYGKYGISKTDAAKTAPNLK